MYSKVYDNIIGKLSFYFYIFILIIILILFLLNTQRFHLLNTHNTILLGSNKFIPGGKNTLRIIVLNQKSQPINNVKIKGELLTNENISYDLFEAYTNKLGTIKTTFKAPEWLEGDYRLRIISKYGRRTEILEQKVFLRHNYEILLYTDKNSYTPGEIIHIRIFILDRSSNTIFEKSNLLMEFYNPFTYRILQKNIPLSQYGTADYDLLLNQNIIQGKYKIKVSWKGYNLEKYIYIKEDNTTFNTNTLSENHLNVYPESNGILLNRLPNITYIKDNTHRIKYLKVDDKKFIFNNNGITSITITPNDNKKEYKFTTFFNYNNKEFQQQFILPVSDFPFLIRTDKKIYDIGENIKFQLFTRINGNYYMDIIQDNNIIMTKSFNVKYGQISDNIFLSPDYTGLIKIVVFRVIGEIIQQNTKTIYINEKKKNNINIDIQKIKPNFYNESEIKLKIKQTFDKNNHDLEGIVGVNITGCSDSSYNENEFLVASNLHGNHLKDNDLNVFSDPVNYDLFISTIEKNFLKIKNEQNITHIILFQILFFLNIILWFILMIKIYKESRLFINIYKNLIKPLLFEKFIINHRVFVILQLFFLPLEGIQTDLKFKIYVVLFFMDFILCIRQIYFSYSIKKTKLNNQNWLFLIKLIPLYMISFTIVEMFFFFIKQGDIILIITILLFILTIHILLVNKINKEIILFENNFSIFFHQKIPKLAVLISMLSLLYIMIFIIPKQFVSFPEKSFGLSNNIKFETIPQNLHNFNNTMNFTESKSKTIYSNPQININRNGDINIKVIFNDFFKNWYLNIIGLINKQKLFIIKKLDINQNYKVELQSTTSLQIDDDIIIPIRISNYNNKNKNLIVELNKTSWFKIKGSDKIILKLKPNEQKNVYFSIKPIETGNHNLEFYIKDDKDLYKYSYRFKINEDSRIQEFGYSSWLVDSAIHKIKIPENSKNNKLYVRLYPSIFNHIQEINDKNKISQYTLDGIFTCLYSSILMLDNLRISKIKSNILENKYTDQLDYLNQILNSYNDLSFDETPINISYGLMILNDMLEVYPLDNTIIDYYKDKLNKYLQQIDIKKVPLKNIAYISWCLTEINDNSLILTSMLDYLKNRINIMTNYEKALTLNAMIKSKKHEEIIRKLLNILWTQKREYNQLIYFKESNTTVFGSSDYIADIETTSLVLYALLKTNKFKEYYNYIINYLLFKKSPDYGWYTPHTTGLVIKVFNEISKKTISFPASVIIRINDKNLENIVLKDNWQELDLSSFLKTGQNNLYIVATGNSLSYQVSGFYSLPWDEKIKNKKSNLEFDIKYDSFNLKQNQKVKACVNILYTGSNDSVIKINIGIPSCFNLQGDEIQKLKKRFRKIFFKNQTLIILCNIKPGKKINFEYNMLAINTCNQSVSISEVSEYYNPQNSVKLSPNLFTVRLY